MSNVYVYSQMYIDRYLYISQNYSYVYMSNTFSQIALHGSSSNLCPCQHIYENVCWDSFACTVCDQSLRSFQLFGWKMFSAIHRKTCARMYTAKLLIIVKNTCINNNKKKLWKPCASQKAISSVPSSEGPMEDNGRHPPEARIRSHGGQGTKRTECSKSRSRDFWVLQPRNFLLCHLQCLWVFVDQTALRFPLFSCLEKGWFTDLISSLSLFIGWIQQDELNDVLFGL